MVRGTGLVEIRSGHALLPGLLDYGARISRRDATPVIRVERNREPLRRRERHIRFWL
jgi:hypothetical protein